MFEPVIQLNAYFADKVGMSFEHDIYRYDVDENYKPIMRWWTGALFSRNSFKDMSENEQEGHGKFLMSYNSSVLSCTYSQRGGKTIHCCTMQDYIKRYFYSDMLTPRWLNRLELFIAERRRDAVTLAFLGRDSPLKRLPKDTWTMIYKHL